jgi:hypothetical protein
MEPHRYLWLRQMRLVQQVLALAEVKTTTVATIANAFGFGQLARFAVAPPTAARIRAIRVS